MSDDRSPGQIVPSGWRAVAGVGAALLLVAGVGLLLVRIAGFGEVRDATERADSTWFVVCLGAQLVALSAYASVFRGALRWSGAPDPGLRLSASVMFASIGATRVFAAGGVGAIAVTYWCFRRARFSAEDALVRVLGFNALFYVAFGIGAWTAALVTATGASGDVPRALALPWLVGVPAIAVAAVAVTERARVERLTRPGGAFARRALAYAVAAVAWARSALGDRAGRRLVGATVLYWLGNVACLWASLRSVGETVPLPELVLAFAAGHAAMILPLPLGGVGGVDAALTYALTAVGVPLAVALVAVGVYRLFSFWLPTVPALAALPLLPRIGRRLEAL
ncbi:MAG TPA: lysylphosphatidylglycerol synthase transmembrane domain-containing protein [Gaiellaceae bacterium]|nr:lysylphosphatidylglycerol synthase transmembrane domain-containing protein [Gaiellaceae bacterium]